jgi:hypothetical protein
LKRYTLRTTFETTHFWKRGYLWGYLRKEAGRKRLLVLLTSAGVKKMFFLGFAHFLRQVFPSPLPFVASLVLGPSFHIMKKGGKGKSSLINFSRN